MEKSSNSAQTSEIPIAVNGTVGDGMSLRGSALANQTKNPFLSSIYKDLHENNKNFIAICVGQTGSGKSWAGIGLAYLLDPDFSNENVVFTIEQFKSLINSGKLKAGSFIVWDEAGAGISSRESLRKENIWATKVAQTIRNRNYGFVLTVPGLGMVDVSIRKLAHYLMNPIYKDKPHMRSKMKLYEIDYNERTDKIYYKCPNFSVGDETIAIGEFWIPMASKELLDQYEKDKEKFQEFLYADDDTRQIELIRPNIQKYSNVVESTGKIKLDWERIYYDYRFAGVTMPGARNIKKILEAEINGERSIGKKKKRGRRPRKQVRDRLTTAASNDRPDEGSGEPKKESQDIGDSQLADWSSGHIDIRNIASDQ
jgi:hypothetical protein